MPDLLASAAAAGDAAPPPRYLTVSEAAAALGLSPSSVQLLVERGLLEAWKTAGGHRRIHPASVEQLVRQRTARAAGGPPSRAPEPGRAPSERAGAAGLDVVIAEDDDFLIKLYETKLRAAGFPVVTRFAGDGVQALLAVGARLPDALILDLNMPGLNGRDTLAALRKDARTARIPVFIVTGMAEDEIAALAPLPPGVAVMPKPVPFERLIGSLQALALVKDLNAT